MLIRDAVGADDEVLDVIAREGDAAAGAAYLALLRSQDARLLVAESDARVVAFGAAVDIAGTRMLTDLFVTPPARGGGVGAELLGELLAGSTERMTFSSQHPAARAAYRRAGMTVRWDLLYLEGHAGGGGPAITAAPWRHGRASLVDQLVSAGGFATADAVVVAADGATRVARLQSDRPVASLGEVLSGLAADTKVSMCVPEHSPVAVWALENGFVVVDQDTFMSTAGASIPDDLHCLDPGLA